MKETAYQIYYRPTGNVISKHSSIEELVKDVKDNLYKIKGDLDIEVAVTTKRKIKIPSELSE